MNTVQALPEVVAKDILPRYSRKEIIAWGIWTAGVVAGFAELERRGMRKREDGDPTLTALLSRYVPGWFLFAVMGAVSAWLNYHFQLAKEAWRNALHHPPDIPR